MMLLPVSGWHPGNCFVLACSFFVNSTDSNLQALCRNCHLFDTPMSEALLGQAVGHNHPLGQQRVVKVYEYSITDSFNARQLRRNVRKAVAEFATRMNEVNFSVWAKNQDGTISQAHTVDNVPETARLEGMAIYMFDCGNKLESRLCTDSGDSKTCPNFHTMGGILQASVSQRGYQCFRHFINRRCESS